MGHQHGIRGGELGVPQHCNATQNQSKTPPVQPLLRSCVGLEHKKVVPIKKSDAEHSAVTINGLLLFCHFPSSKFGASELFDLSELFSPIYYCS